MIKFTDLSGAAVFLCTPPHPHFPGVQIDRSAGNRFLLLAAPLGMPILRAIPLRGIRNMN